MGKNNPNYGRKHSDEVKKNMSIAQKKLWKNPEHRKKMIENHAHLTGKNSPNYGKTRLYKKRKPVSDEIKLKISNTLKGRKSPNKGKKLTDAQKLNISIGTKKGMTKYYNNLIKENKNAN